MKLEVTEGCTAFSYTVNDKEWVDLSNEKRKDCNIKDSLITTKTKISDSILGLFIVLTIINIIWLIYALFNL